MTRNTERDFNVKYQFFWQLLNTREQRDNRYSLRKREGPTNQSAPTQARTEHARAPDRKEGAETMFINLRYITLITTSGRKDKNAHTQLMHTIKIVS